MFIFHRERRHITAWEIPHLLTVPSADSGFEEVSGGRAFQEDYQG
jgi:hypothetical protein